MIRKRFAVALAAGMVLPLAGSAFGQANDLLRGAVDPYIPGGERAKFLGAAGQDSELTSEEFEADLKGGKKFAREFDKWASLAMFDANRDSKIDWFEADAYRRALRTAVIGKYDANGNGRLDDAERAEAAKDLAAGNAPSPERPAAARGNAPRQGGAAFNAPQGQGRGQGGQGNFLQNLTPEQRERVQAQIQKYDTDKDGQLNREERQAAFLDRFDADKDGQISDEERQNGFRTLREEFGGGQGGPGGRGGFGQGQRPTPEQIEQFQAQFRERQQTFLKSDAGKKVLAKYDANGDGDLTQEEYQAIGEDFRAAAVKKFDANGNGEIDGDERQAAFQAFQNGEDIGGPLDAETMRAWREAMFPQGQGGFGGRGQRGQRGPRGQN